MLVLAIVTSCTTPPAAQTSPVPPATHAPAPTLVEVELNYDDGTARDLLSAGSGGGYLVVFQAPSNPFSVKKVRMFGKTGGALSAQSFEGEIWDKDRKVVHNSNHSITMFSASPGWVEIDIPNVEVNGKFYVHVFTGTGSVGGIFIGADDSVSNQHSTITVREGGLTRESSTWSYRSDMWFGDKSRVNWMIRVVGTASTPSPISSASPARFEVVSLDIKPAEAMLGEKISVTAQVKNTGGSEGAYAAVLTLDGQEIETKRVIVSAGTGEMAIFSLSPNSPGIYRVTLAGLIRVLTVKDQQGLPSGYVLEKKLHSQDDKIEIFDITYVSDGLKVKGYLAQPKAPGLYAAVIWNRGGNRDFSMLQPDSLKPYAINGYVAIGSQYRGSPGSEGLEEFGGADVNDVLNLVSSLKSLPNVDIDRVGMVGYSRGGMMTYLVLKEQSLSKTSYIKAACTVGGLADLFMGAKERPDMVTGVFVPLIGGTPSQEPQKYEARSVTYWADKINTPLLIQHGEADDSVSVEQAKKLAQELEKHRKVYKLITYPDDDHGLSAHNGGLSEILKWLSQYLK